VSPFSASLFRAIPLVAIGSLVPIFARPVCPLRLVEPAGSKMVLASGEESRVTVSGDDLWPGSSASTVPGTAGYYQIAQGVSGASAVFRIAMPHLEAAAAVRINDITYTDPATGAKSVSRHTCTLFPCGGTTRAISASPCRPACGTKPWRPMGPET